MRARLNEGRPSGRRAVLERGVRFGATAVRSEAGCAAAQRPVEGQWNSALVPALPEQQCRTGEAGRHRHRRDQHTQQLLNGLAATEPVDDVALEAIYLVHPGEALRVAGTNLARREPGHERKLRDEAFG